MRGCTLDGDPVLLIYITKAAMFTTHSASSIIKAVRGSVLGKTQDKRAYLKPGSMDHTIKEGNSARQSGILLFLKDSQWPSTLLTQIKKVRYEIYSYKCYIHC